MVTCRPSLLTLSVAGAAVAAFGGPARAAGTAVAMSEAQRLGMDASLYVAADKGLFAEEPERGGRSNEAPLPCDRMIDNYFALEATPQFGIAR